MQLPTSNTLEDTAAPGLQLNVKKHDAEKHRGAHIFGRYDSMALQPFVQTNIEWIALVPYASQKDYNTPEIIHNRRQDVVEGNKRWLSKIATAHAAGMKVFLKPHIWMHDPSEGKWRSDIYFDNTEDWNIWSSAYRDFILRYAKVAEQGQVELFCIGTELTRISLEHPDFWTTLIDEVKAVYTGEITYAANWYEEYHKISFWAALDYIGIQAYFPLVDHNKPSADALAKGWQKHKEALADIAKTYDRKILFTELGYKSTTDSGSSPWDWISYNEDSGREVCNDTQQYCYEVFFKEIWPEFWFAGAHLWQFRSDFKKGTGKSAYDFTPQGKPALEAIKLGFRR